MTRNLFKKQTQMKNRKAMKETEEDRAKNITELLDLHVQTGARLQRLAYLESESELYKIQNKVKDKSE